MLTITILNETTFLYLSIWDVLKTYYNMLSVFLSPDETTLPRAFENSVASVAFVGSCVATFWF